MRRLGLANAFKRLVFKGLVPQRQVYSSLVCTVPLKHQGNSKYFTEGIKSTIKDNEKDNERY